VDACLRKGKEVLAEGATGLSPAILIDILVGAAGVGQKRAPLAIVLRLADWLDFLRKLEALVIKALAEQDYITQHIVNSEYNLPSGQPRAIS